MQVSPEQVVVWATLAGSIIGVYVKLVARITAIETKIDIFWKNVSFDAAKILHSPDPAHQHIDHLIDAYLLDELDTVGLSMLMDILRKKMDNAAADRSERLAASVMLRAVEQRLMHLLKHLGGSSLTGGNQIW